MNRVVLDCGLTIIHEYRPTFPSFSMSYTLKSGSRGETEKNMGVHHFIEHMIFKGSSLYSLKDIAEISDRIGGNLNAFTGKEITQYFLKALDLQFDMAFELLTDIVFNSEFQEEEFLREKNVIIQELRESEDSPEIYSFELFYQKAFKNNGIAYPIGGVEDVVQGFTRDSVYRLYKDLYKPENIVLSVCGNVSLDKVVDSATKQFRDFPKALPGVLDFEKPLLVKGSHLVPENNIQQSYLIMGLPGISAASEDKYDFMVMNDVLGAGMSSRLFQKIREEMGLAYTISAFPDSFFDTGLHILYGIVEARNLNSCVKEIMGLIEEFRTGGIKSKELMRSKDHIKSSILLGLESNSARMRFFTNRELYHEDSVSMEQLIKEIDSITVDSVNHVADTYLDVSDIVRFCYGDCKNIEGF